MKTRILLATFISTLICNIAPASSKSLHNFAKETQAINSAQAKKIDTTCTKEVAQTKPKIAHLHSHEQTYKLEITRLECETKNLQESSASTQGTLAMLEYIYAEYDKLLNKYYKLYHTEFKKQNKSTPSGIFSHEPSIQKGQDTLLDEQRAWLKLRDSYAAYLQAAHAHTYEANGGGTIWGIETANARLKFLQKRVETLFWRYNAMLADEGIGLDSVFNHEQ